LKKFKRVHLFLFFLLGLGLLLWSATTSQWPQWTHKIDPIKQQIESPKVIPEGKVAASREHGPYRLEPKSSLEAASKETPLASAQGESAQKESSELAHNEKSCVKQFYEHPNKNDPNLNAEEWLDIKNVIPLIEEKINLHSVCVRVNGTPIHYRLIKKQAHKFIVFDSIAGPSSKVSVSYCFGKVMCQEKCHIPKDEFLDAIGAYEEENYDFSVTVEDWDLKDNKKRKLKDEEALQGELKGLRNVLALSDGENKIFSDWKKIEEKSFCKKIKRTAMHSSAQKIGALYEPQ